MHVTIAIDSFKGSLSSMQAGIAAAEGVRRVFSDAQIQVFPLADGGEGTVEALVSGLRGEMVSVQVEGPLGKPVLCRYGMIPEERLAIIEIASAAGLTLLAEEERNPLYTSSFDVGQMIVDAISKDCRRFIVGVGGSATNDGGVGMLQALGYHFLDRYGCEIPKGAVGLQNIADIQTFDVIPELSECQFVVACDVTNPLCGKNGASAVYGPQKGADEEMVVQMDMWLAAYASMVKSKIQSTDPNCPGAGAAGGLGFAFLSFMNAQLRSGIQTVLEELGIEETIARTDFVITGEGRLDEQTCMGKAPAGVAQLAQKYRKPVIAVAGVLGEQAQICNAHGIDAFFPILRRITTLDEAMDTKEATKNMIQSVEQILRLIQCVFRASGQ